MVDFPSTPAADSCVVSPTFLLPVLSSFFGALVNLLTRTVRDVPAPLVLLASDLCTLFFGGSAAALFVVYNGAL